MVNAATHFLNYLSISVIIAGINFTIMKIKQKLSKYILNNNSLVLTGDQVAIAALFIIDGILAVLLNLFIFVKAYSL